MFDPSKYSDEELLAEYQRAKGAKQPQPTVATRPQGTIITDLLDKINPKLTNSLIGAAEGFTGKTVTGSKSVNNPYATEYAKQAAKAQFKNSNGSTGVYSFNPTKGEFEPIGEVPKGSIVRNTTTPDDISAKEVAKSAAQYGGDMATSDRAMSLRKEFQALPTVQEYQTIKNQVSSMDALLNESPKFTESRVALDQGLISIFNKITDPTSVVRESEYERTPQNLSLANRFTGALEKLKSGGAGLTQEDRRALVFGAKIVANSRGKGYNDVLSNYDTLSGRFGVDPTLVTSGYGKHTDFPYVLQQQINQPQATLGNVGDGQTMSFTSEQEAEAANLPPGTQITINGRRAVIQ